MALVWVLTSWSTKIRSICAIQSCSCDRATGVSELSCFPLGCGNKSLLFGIFYLIAKNKTNAVVSLGPGEFCFSRIESVDSKHHVNKWLRLMSWFLQWWPHQRAPARFHFSKSGVLLAEVVWEIKTEAVKFGVFNLWHTGERTWQTDASSLVTIRMASHDIKIDTREELDWKVKTEVLRVSDHISLLIFLCKTVIIILS